MNNLAVHPTVMQHRARPEQPVGDPGPLDGNWLKQIVLDAGADDVGFVEIDRPEIAGERGEIQSIFPRARTLISFVCRMNRENIRSPARSIANLEFHHTGDRTNEIAMRIVAALERKGIRAINGGAMGFPMEMDRWPERLWVVSHKPVAVAAGLGQMGIHRNVIHPTFGNFILLGTVVMEAQVTAYSRPVDYNPCLECKLCVAACPTGAIHPDGHFDFAACYTHNYREFMGGFSDWVETIAEAGGAREYRRRVSDPETVSMWQSLSFGPNYKAAYCLAVCPAGEDVIAPFLDDRKQYLEEQVRPLQDKSETIYVVPGSDPEEYVARRFPNKRAKRVHNGLRPRSIRGFLSGLRLTFQRNQAKGLDAVYHFTFTGDEEVKATVVIRNQTLRVSQGHVGKPSLRLKADSRTWLGFLAKEASLPWALLRGKVRLHGSPTLLMAFGRYFPS